MDEQKQEREPLKRIDMDAGSFTANGKTYFIEGALTIERYAEFQILEKELAYGLSVKGLYDELKKVIKLLDKLRFVDCGVALTNIVRGIAKVEEREPIVLKICALYLNEKDEDRTVINEDMITQKIADWKKEGIDIRDFFTLAFGSVSGFHAIYKNVAQDILESPNVRAAANQ